ncbi:hypothetical protein [Tenuibacillus multivorans]|uniref:Uncharacterized protein n=1 Tax=Tenuibacillus multivorans TaxID=237069 RepID=A0A1H0DT24_9BACI|nr:hypothetical protein [Tenuibacillus multivorans]GEL78823.1 hypothetical protein TMU01_30580 [Tenuibacillus multivorans]SDN73131.1 hypothetical protein SAMN05216498_2928 [Tenuibacillus multivorans]
MIPDLNHHLLTEHKRNMEKINRHAWIYRQTDDKENQNNEKQFCFTLIKKWCITISYS